MFKISLEKLMRKTGKAYLLRDKKEGSVRRMVVDKVINNNIVSAFDETGTEVVLMGRGIGFGTKPGKRIGQGIKPENALLWEIKQFYPQEFRLGQYAVELIKERLGMDMPEDEAGFIALHFVNAEYGTDIRDALNFPNLMKEILEIAQESLQIELDESTLHYERFVTHVKFLLQRIYRRELLTNEEKELVEMMQKKYPREYACSRRIADYIEQATECKLSGEEVMYLAIHIRRVTMAEDATE